MLQPGWIDLKRNGIAACRVLLLVAGSVLLAGCGLLGVGSGASSGTSGDAPVAAPSPELEARYASLVADLKSTDQARADAAVDAMETFSREHPDLAGPLLNLGLVRVRAGDPAGALALFNEAAAACNRCGAVWNEIGVLDVHQGRFADAEQAYRRAIELAPDDAAAYYNLAILYELYIPRPELAVQNYERYLQLGGDGKDVEQWLVDLRRRVNDVAKAARADGPS